MALTTCPECGHLISEEAEICPGCGYPYAKKKWEEEAQEAWAESYYDIQRGK